VFCPESGAMASSFFEGWPTRSLGHWCFGFGLVEIEEEDLRGLHSGEVERAGHR